MDTRNTGWKHLDNNHTSNNNLELETAQLHAAEMRFTMTVKNGKNTEAFERQKGKGRPKGAVNKTTAAIKDMVASALDEAGGIDYLVRQAEANPTAFMTLVGKVIPTQISGQLDHAVKVTGALKWQAPQ